MVKYSKKNSNKSFTKKSSNPSAFHIHQKTKLYHRANNFSLSTREIEGIINYLSQLNSAQNLLIFYFLLVKGLNYTQVSRILVTNFKKDLSLLFLKQKKKYKYRIHPEIRNILLEFIHTQGYKNKFVFYNQIKDEKEGRRALYIKNKFSDIIYNCFWINNQRKNQAVHFFSKKRSPKWNFDINLFTKNIDLFDKSISMSERYFSYLSLSEIENHPIKNVVMERRDIKKVENIKNNNDKEIMNNDIIQKIINLN